MVTSSATALSASTARSLTSMAFEQLRADILTGELRPEERLRIQGLSERYKVGATAIREALSRLVTDGLVESEDQRGFCVAPVSVDELVDLTRTRIQVEQLALRQAVAQGDIDWESNLLSSFHRLSRSEAPSSPEKHAAWTTAHRQFHEAVLAGCRSPWLMRLCRLLYDKSERYRNVAERQPGSQVRDVDTEHRRLMDAAMARDAESACKVLEEHFWQTAEITLKAGFGGQATRKKLAR
ncbi:DNA-binding GntR family transcriptional regulator [Hydrogenophaga palleronii]|uniref:DNA-binding GntR family transcriptional regulator n=1 Tax=Hydrogenophaga palleronii TaxID=65655 RepID=A0ABU1WRW8_9BURK|nr:FCD domain-containing protein [Hydrogenophaga palleronii]MDR7152030.1 DNA-binding GntR family transcriptional regulator [Hydrogenophaga palleronii]